MGLNKAVLEDLETLIKYFEIFIRKEKKIPTLNMLFNLLGKNSSSYLYRQLERLDILNEVRVYREQPKKIEERLRQLNKNDLFFNYNKDILDILNIEGFYDLTEDEKDFEDKEVYIEKLVEEESKISYYKQQVSLWKKKYNHLLKISAPEQQLIEDFRNSLPRYKDVNVGFGYNPDMTNTNEELILLLSDTHIGENVILTDMIDGKREVIINEYNITIFEERMKKLYEGLMSIVDRLETNTIYNTFNLFMLGDMVSGIIHEELLENGDTITDQVILGAEIVSEFIYELAKRFPNVKIYGVGGNHGRFKKKPYFKNKWNNFDYLFYKFIEVKFENVSNVECVFPKSSMIIVNKFDKWNFLIRHGDGKSQSFAGIPVYGIMRTSAKATQMLSATQDIYIHYEVLGHFHTPMSLPKPVGKIIINGTLKGTDEFAFNQFLATDVSQKLLVCNKQYGVFADFDIFCE